MTNEYGLDVDYFKGKLKIILRDIGYFTPQEMYNALTRLAGVAAQESKSFKENQNEINRKDK